MKCLWKLPAYSNKHSYKRINSENLGEHNEANAQSHMNCSAYIQLL